MAQGITLAKALECFARELGCGDSRDREALLDEVRSSVEFLMFNGGGDILRQWQVVARQGRFTLPRDLITPVKFKYCDVPDFGYGTFNSAYFSFGSHAVKDCCNFYEWGHHFEIAANKVATQHKPPSQGVRLLATTRLESDVGKKIMVNGRRKLQDPSTYPQ